MRRKTETVLIVVGFIGILVTIWFSIEHPKSEVLNNLVIVVGLFFFIYKLLTGWLFINMNVSVEHIREAADADSDNLVFKVSLSKGNIDSVWIKNIEIKISEVEYQKDNFSFKEITIIRPIGIKKMDGVMDDESKTVNYWKGQKSLHYIISPNEQATFSALVKVKNEAVIAAEVLVLGIRPFYNIESKKLKPIQWKTSAIVLPRLKTKAVD